jgi:hypothetical protein
MGYTGEGGGDGDEGRRERSHPFIFRSGWSLWYCLSSPGACISSAFSQVLSLSRYPFHLIRYWRCFDLLKFQCAFICLTLYSSSPSIRSGGGWEKFGPCKRVLQ